MERIRTHPGEVLREEFMKPLGLSANALALALRVPATRIGDILRAEKPRPADTAIRLALFQHYLGFWLNLQSAYDLSVALAEQGPAIERDVHLRAGFATWRRAIIRGRPRLRAAEDANPVFPGHPRDWC